MDKGNYKDPKALYSLYEIVVYKGPEALLSLYETMTIYKGPEALLSLCETMTIYKGPKGAVITQIGPTDQYAIDLFFPNRHAHLSLYQVLNRQSMCILCSVHISYSRILIAIR